MKRVVLILLFLLFFLPLPVEAGIVGALIREKTAKIGETYKGTIFIVNSGEKEQEIKIYQTDYLYFCDGRNIYGEPGKQKRSNADWISFSPHRLKIPPKQTASVDYTVNVPNNNKLTGTYWSMLMVEGVGSLPELTETKGKIKMGIRTIVRYGIQMVTHVGDTGARRLKFLKTKLLKEEERRILQVDMENIGERWLRPFLWAELYDEEGSYIGRFEGGRLRIYPGTSVRYRLDLSQVPKGEYKALVVANCGGEDVFGVTYTLKFEK